ncbi:MAG: glyceraldehyde 3-phosphate dehydrogenase NAD-binding domain-containing protein [Syntrophorhabdales bacterium]
MPRVAVNGMGKIGRAVLRIVCATAGLELVGLNDLLPARQVARLLQFDPVHGTYEKAVDLCGEDIAIGGSRVRLFREKDPSRLPWKDLGVDVVFECTGAFRDREGMSKHLRAGARKVLLSTQAEDRGIETIIYGVDSAETGADLISCASCAANCIAPVIEVMKRRIGIKKIALTTPHSTAVHGSNALSSASEMVFLTERETSAEEVNTIFREESRTERYRGVLGTSDEWTAVDVAGDCRASVVDLEMTRVTDGDLAKISSRHDNEWGYSSQMVRVAAQIARR